MAEMVVRNLGSVLRNVAQLGAKYAVDVRLVAVSKTFPSELIYACYEQGQLHFGENYLDELERKAAELAERGASHIRWHYIGRLQSNKIKKICAVPNLYCVETLDSQKHCDMLQSAAAFLEKHLCVFIQVNTSNEKNKGGVEPDELPTLAKYLRKSAQTLTCLVMLGFKFRFINIDHLGLMTIGSTEESKNPEENADFARLRNLRDGLMEQLDCARLELSMGMSQDYPLAIKYGSTNVRVGSTIFGQRTYPDKTSANC